MNNAPSIHRSSNGFSLIEVLFAVLILSVGILGMAGLQVTSIQENRSALLRAQAVQLANSMLDRIRANPTATYDAASFSAAPSSTSNCLTDTCNVSQMAKFDVADWKCSINSSDAAGAPYSTCQTLGIAGQLPGGAGQLQVTSATHLMTVSVRWLDSPNGDTNTITLQTKTQ